MMKFQIVSPTGLGYYTEMKFLHSAYIACNLENNISQCHRRGYWLVVVEPFVLPIILLSDDTSGNKSKREHV